MTPQPILQQLLPAWESFHAITDIGPIRDENHYERMSDILDTLLLITGGDERHPAMGLVDIVGDLIQDYEAEHYPLPATTDAQALRFLMEQEGLEACDLPEVGDSDEISALLNGHRDPTLAQVRALARRFSVSPATFI